MGVAFTFRQKKGCSLGYKTVRDGVKDERYKIVDEGTLGMLRDTTSNLSENELKIFSLEVEDCPLDQLCVYLYGGGVTSICKYAGFYPNVIDRGRLITEKLLCKYEHPPIDRKVSVLRAEKCAAKKENCVDCAHIENIIVPPERNPKKSHACVVCRLTEGEE